MRLLSAVQMMRRFLLLRYYVGLLFVVDGLYRNIRGLLITKMLSPAAPTDFSGSESHLIGCPWPCVSIAAALWAQKVKHWSDFLVFAAAQTVFHHDDDAIVQLLGVCFTTALGLNSSVSSNGGVGALLGHDFGFSGRISVVAPGTLYLTVHRAVRSVILMTQQIVSLLMETVKDIANSGLPQENLEKLKKTKYSTKYGQVSLATAMTQVKIVASLGASLIWLTGELNSIQSLFKEILASWFISTHGSEQEWGSTVLTLGGYALAYFTQFSGLFASGVDSASPASREEK